MEIKTEVWMRDKAQFDAAGTFLGYTLKKLPEEISPGLARRLVNYATKRMKEAGFGSILRDAEVEVYTLGGEWRRQGRNYTVRFTTPLGGYVELSGIMTTNGWPSLDNNFAIGND